MMFVNNFPSDHSVDTVALAVFLWCCEEKGHEDTSPTAEASVCLSSGLSVHCERFIRFQRVNSLHLEHEPGLSKWPSEAS